MMFREMRLKKQQLSKEEAEAVLNKVTSGVLSVVGDGGYPYGVPLSHVYKDGKIYFHCAKKGHKVDAVQADGKASFTVIAMDDVSQEDHTTHFQSVVVFGKARVLTDEQSKRNVMEYIMEKYTPDDREGGAARVSAQINAFDVIELDIEHMTGKRSG